MGDGRAEDPPAAMVDTGLLNNFVARWFVGLVQFLHRIRTIESHATKYSLILYEIKDYFVLGQKSRINNNSRHSTQFHC